jgi:ribosomal-protein-alanine N-acetyltransferase
MLETARLLLRPMRAEDVDDLLGVFADPNVMASFGVPAFGRPQMERWVRRNLEHQDRYGYGLFSVLLKPDRLLIGDCGLERMDDGDMIQAELGYDIRSDHWNRGYATEAATAVRDYAFEVLELPRLISLIRKGNAASRRVAEKVGMRLAEEAVRDGVPYWIFAICRHEHLAAEA